jgi:hypothetical protein
VKIHSRPYVNGISSEWLSVPVKDFQGAYLSLAFVACVLWIVALRLFARGDTRKSRSWAGNVGLAAAMASAAAARTYC